MGVSQKGREWRRKYTRKTGHRRNSSGVDRERERERERDRRGETRSVGEISSSKVLIPERGALADNDRENEDGKR